MGRKNLSEIRQKEIIIAFYTVAKKIGLENTSIAKVAEEMGISKGLVMHYFATKESLLVALKDYILEKYLSFIDSEKLKSIDSKEKLEEFIMLLFSRKWNDYVDDGLFYSFYAQVYRNKDFNKSFKSFLETLHNVLKNRLLDARNNGIIVNTNIDELTEIIFALIDGAYYYLGTFTDNRKEYEKQVTIYMNHVKQLIEYKTS
ncbi:TetR family transcriptional regulator [Aquimarina algiphila]|uniref:Biofilm operon icaADBC HTH-type negative transcriptional regulator IcaR n=1 Tax=Aquimarina algiphila TaxID=2047982 RepID=A0A554VPX4_9FLAO|nr:TetR family transcriptional regulator [Aquimarina algiphila]TSE10516.1 TetR/AcrR family transcriptional regulator [Aquimarina algiphila]